MKQALIFLLVTFISYKSFSQNWYACFENDKNTKLKISVYFDKRNKATYVKYKGQKDSASLYFVNREVFKNEGGHPRAYWSETYTEKYNGKVTGTYRFSNVGTFGLDVNFTREKDRKEFYFVIIEGTMDAETNKFPTVPCF